VLPLSAGRGQERGERKTRRFFSARALQPRPSLLLSLPQVRAGQIPRPIARLPKTPGCDLAGIVESTTGGRFKKGDRVFGIVGAIGSDAGTCAQFCLVPEAQLAPLPASLTMEQGAAIPLACLTAWQALDAGRVGAGQKVLVTAAAGGVGSFATALAAARGAVVSGTASSRNAAYITGRGVMQAIDYTTAPDDAVTATAAGEEGRKFDVAIDVMGGATEDVAYAATKDKGGRFVSIMNSGTSLVKVAGRTLRGALGLGRKYSFVVLSINARTGERLEEVAGLIETGKMAPPEVKVFKGLAAVPAAMTELEGGHVRGKVVVQVAEE